MPSGPKCYREVAESDPERQIGKSIYTLKILPLLPRRAYFSVRFVQVFLVRFWHSEFEQSNTGDDGERVFMHFRMSVDGMCFCHCDTGIHVFCAHLTSDWNAFWVNFAGFLAFVRQPIQGRRIAHKALQNLQFSSFFHAFFVSLEKSN